MQKCKWKRIGVTLGIAVVALASSLAPSKAQAVEIIPWITNNPIFARITNTNGVTWKKEIKWAHLWFEVSQRPKIAEIVVPEHAIIRGINVGGCVNLTNIVLHPLYPVEHEQAPLAFTILEVVDSGLRTIACKQTMRDLIRLDFSRENARFQAGEWHWPAHTVQWIDLKELPQIEIKARTTANGKELVVIWRDGNLQIADAVNGKWRDHFGASPLIFPLAIAKAQQFFRIRKGDD